MITMTIHHGEEVQRQELPCDFLSLRMSLYEMNLMRSPEEVSVRDVNGSFESDGPIGQKFIQLIRPTDLLSDIDLAAHQLKAAPQAIQEAMRQELMDGAFETIDDIHIGRDRLLEEMCGARQFYYFPLACSVEDEDGELYETDENLTQYAEQIQDAIRQDQTRDLDTMAMYFWCHDPEMSDSIKGKLLTAVWSIQEMDGSLYGQVEVTSTAPLTPEESEAMKDWICGQNSDGFGEGFEQRPIETVNGDLYVHFWSSDPDYFIATEKELDQELSAQTWGCLGI